MSSPVDDKPIAVLLDVDFDFSLQVLQGIQRYAHREQRWRLLPLHSTQQTVFESLLGRHLLAGVIGAMLSDRWLKGLPGGAVPMVNISDQSEIRAVPSVISDNYRVGGLAARHLLDQGCQSFGVVYETASAAAVHRRDGFAAAIAASGYPLAEPPPSDSYAPDAAWPAWLARLPRPCGLFCSSDYLARRLMRHIRALPAEIPRDMAVIGVGNLPIDNLLAQTPLTSIELDGIRIGEMAASRLASLMARNPAPAHTLIPPLQLVPRASSVQRSAGDPLVARAVAHQDLAQPMTGEHLAKLCGASKRTLEMRFKKSLGCGPATALRQRRLGHAALLLRETPMALAAIAEATGFANASCFSCAFRKAYGHPPGVWRGRQQTPGEQPA